ncbi:hypothetical protein Tco_0559577, partial [Tanacetum coccineum]
RSILPTIVTWNGDRSGTGSRYGIAVRYFLKSEPSIWSSYEHWQLPKANNQMAHFGGEASTNWLKSPIVPETHPWYLNEERGSMTKRVSPYDDKKQASKFEDLSNCKLFQVVAAMCSKDPSLSKAVVKAT